MSLITLLKLFVSHRITSDLLSFQRAHVHLHDRCQLAMHSADHVPAHLRLHRADSAAAEASHRGRRGDPEPRGRGERGGRARREDASHQAAQNRWVEDLITDTEPSQ